MKSSLKYLATLFTRYLNRCYNSIEVSHEFSRLFSIQKRRNKEKTSSTGGMNSITYNISCCGRKDEKTPIKPIQIEAMCHCAALKCKELGLSVNDCYTHSEIGKMVQDGRIKNLLPYNKLLEQNIGKIDFAGLGNTLRKKIQWYYSKIK